MVDDGPGYLWANQWSQLDAVLRSAGVQPSSFDRVAHLDRKGWLGPKVLAPNEQWAEFRHNPHRDLWLRLQFHDAVQDLDGDLIHDEGWTIWASPATDGRPRSRGVQTVEADDFDDVVDTAELWAAVVARELRARGIVTMAQERARNEWGPTKGSTGRPLELTRLAGFIEDELPHLVEEALRVRQRDRRPVV